jgi:L-2-hydroxyglutarate oxidase
MKLDADFAVVGAGIVGLAVARELTRRHPMASVVVLDKESDVGVHQTGHNSGVVHGGVYYEPGSLKARLCVEGARLMYEFCEEHGVAYERCGKLIVARGSEELGRLDALEARGVANRVPGLRRIRGSAIPEIEPHAVGVAALHAPDTGIVDYREVCRAMQRELVAHGADIVLGVAVTALTADAGRPRIVHTAGSLRAGTVVVCAGLWADRLARAAGASPDPRIVPFRGAYLHLAPDTDPVVRGMVYPVPDPRLPFLGVHVTKHIDGSVSLGPTAMLVPSRDAYRLRTVRARDVWETLTWPGTWSVIRTHWRIGARELHMALRKRAFVKAAAHYVPRLSMKDLAGATSAGIRAQAVTRSGRLVDDFVISQVGDVHHVRNAPSPAATSAFALARELVDRIERGERASGPPSIDA